MPVLAQSAPRVTDEYVDLDLKYHRKYSVSYTYSPSTGRYERYMNGEKHMEADGSKVIEADNVLVVNVKTRVLDKYGRLDMDLVSGGEASLHRSGKIIEGKWRRDDIYGGIMFTDKSGRKCPLNPGKTWVQFINQRATMAVARRPVSDSERSIAQRVAAAGSGARVITSTTRTTPARPALVAHQKISRVYPANPVRVAPTPDMYPKAEPVKPSVQVSTAPKASTPSAPGEIDVIDFELEAF